MAGGTPFSFAAAALSSSSQHDAFSGGRSEAPRLGLWIPQRGPPSRAQRSGIHITPGSRSEVLLVFPGRVSFHLMLLLE